MRIILHKGAFFVFLFVFENNDELKKEINQTTRYLAIKRGQETIMRI